MTTHGRVLRVSVVSTGQVQIRPDHVRSTWRPMFVWLLASRQWTGPRPINGYVIEHRDGVVIFDTGQDRASVTEPRAPLLMVGELTYDVHLFEQGHVPGVGSRRRLRETTALVNKIRERIPDLVILPAHDPAAAERLAQATGETLSAGPILSR